MVNYEQKALDGWGVLGPEIEVYRSMCVVKNQVKVMSDESNESLKEYVTTE